MRRIRLLRVRELCVDVFWLAMLLPRKLFFIRWGNWVRSLFLAFSHYNWPIAPQLHKAMLRGCEIDDRHWSGLCVLRVNLFHKMDYPTFQTEFLQENSQSTVPWMQHPQGAFGESIMWWEYFSGVAQFTRHKAFREFRKADAHLVFRWSITSALDASRKNRFGAESFGDAHADYFVILAGWSMLRIFGKLHRKLWL